MSNVITGHNTAFASKDEATFGTALDPAVTDFFRATDLTITIAEERLARNDIRGGSRSAEAAIRGKRTVEASLTFDDAPSGTVATAPDVDPLYLTGYAKKTNAAVYTVQAAPGPATTGATVDDSTGLTVGDILSVPCADESGAAIAVAVRLTNIATNALTWAPATPNAPVENATIRSGIQYTLSENNTTSVAMYKYYGIDATNYHADLIECMAGAFATAFEYTIDPGGLTTVAVTMAGKDLARFPSMGLNEDIAADKTDWTVDDCRAEIYTAGRGAYIMGDDPDTDETVAVTATDDTNSKVTVVRSTSAVVAGTYDDEDSMYPYYPGATTAGNSSAGIIGRIYIQGTKYCITGATISHTEGSAARMDCFGDATATGKMNAEQREITVTLSGYLLDDEERWQIADRKESTVLMVQAGTQQGSIHAFSLPTVEFEPPAISGAKNEEVPLELTCMAFAIDGSLESELRHAYL